MNIILKSLPAIVLALTVRGIAFAESAPKQLEFAITSATNPTGKGGYSGTVAFTREDTKNAFKVTWTLSDGSTQKGWGVPYPDSGFIAVRNGVGVHFLTSLRSYPGTCGSGNLLRQQKGTDYLRRVTAVL